MKKIPQGVNEDLLSNESLIVEPQLGDDIMMIDGPEWMHGQIGTIIRDRRLVEEDNPQPLERGAHLVVRLHDEELWKRQVVRGVSRYTKEKMLYVGRVEGNYEKYKDSYKRGAMNLDGTVRT